MEPKCRFDFVKFLRRGIHEVQPGHSRILQLRQGFGFVGRPGEEVLIVLDVKPSSFANV